MPRFVNNAGDLRQGIDWTLNDYIVDTNRNKLRFSNDQTTKNRNWTTPYSPRTNLTQQRMDKRCEIFDLELQQAALGAYETCALRFNKEDYLSNWDYKMQLFFDHSNRVYSWNETCNLTTRQCTWEKLDLGVTIEQRYRPGVQQTLLFESNSGSTEEFTIKAKTNRQGQTFLCNTTIDQQGTLKPIKAYNCDKTDKMCFELFKQCSVLMIYCDFKQPS